MTRGDIGLGGVQARRSWFRPWMVIPALIVALVLVLGTLVGYARWRIGRVETADVVRSVPVALEGPYGEEWTVVGDTAYGRDPAGRIAMVSLAGGGVHYGHRSNAHRVLPGPSGDVALEAGHDVSLYDRAGHRLWSVSAGFGAQVVAVGDGDATLLACNGKGNENQCDLLHVGVGGTVDAQTSTDLDADLTTLGALQYDVDDDVRALPAPALAVRLASGRAFPVVAGHPVGPGVKRDVEGAGVAVAGDVLVGISHSGSTCHYEAVRGSTPLWHTDLDCSGLDPEYGFDFPEVWVFADRVGVTYGRLTGGERSPYVSIDLSDGRASRPTLPARGDSGHSWQTPDAIIRLHDLQLTANDPVTGKRLWSTVLPFDDDADAARSVQVSGDVVTWDVQVPSWWASFALGHRHDGRKPTADAITFVDAATGREFARVSGGWGYQTYGIGPHRAMLAVDGRVKVVD